MKKDSEKFEKYAAEQKKRQSEYRKLQYQRQKLWAAKRKQKQNAKEQAANYPESVSLSLKYFEENGFTFQDRPTGEELISARKKLSRVFHPDAGGTHQESTELNRHYEVLFQYFVSP